MKEVQHLEYGIDVCNKLLIFLYLLLKNRRKLHFQCLIMKLWESLNGLKTIANLIEKHEQSITRKKLVEEPSCTTIKDSYASSSNQIGHQFHNYQHVNLMFLDPTMVAYFLKDFKMLDVVTILQDFKKSTLSDSLLCDDYKEIQVVENRE